MARNLFLQLKKYSGGAISQDENYVTEALATLLEEFPSFRTYLVRELCNIELEPEATVRTQVIYETGQLGLGRAILDLVIEDTSNFIIIEVKVESGLNYYEAVEGGDQVVYSQITKYENCEGLPTNKSISIFTLSKYPLHVKAVDYHYFKHEVLWRTLFAKMEDYHRTLASETPEKYLLGKFMCFLKEEGMAGFQGFKIDHLPDLAHRAEINAVCEEHRRLIKDNITMTDFRGKDQVAYGRDGIIYEWEHDKDVKIFVGLWLSDELYYFKFRRQGGPQVMVFFELPPKHKLRSVLLSSEAYAKVSKEFARQKDGWQILLRRRPLIEFLDSDDQGESLLEFYRESIDDLQQSGLLAELAGHKE
jgi:hypothetical protein